MKSIIVSGSGLVLVALTALLGAAACDGAGGDNTSGSGGAGILLTTSDTTSDTTTTATTTTAMTTTTATTTSTGSGMATSGLIDDMEDMDGAILTAEGRQGSWYTYSDGTSTMTPPPGMFATSAITPPRDNSKYAVRMVGTGFKSYGAGMGFPLRAAGAPQTGYDASGFSKITFWARIGAGASAALRFNVADKDTASEGGVCDNAAGKCNDHFGIDLTLTEDWKQYTLNFSDLKQVGYGQAFPQLLTSALYGMSFAVGVNVSFDVWVDDIAFVK